LTLSAEKNHVSVLELDINALKHNVNYFKTKVKPSTKILAVVKAFAYGHDAIVISKILEDINIDYLAVAYADEGITLRQNGIKTPILVLHPQPQNFGKLIEYNLEPNIYSKNGLEKFAAVVKENNLEDYPIHLKFNTGLNRLGFAENQIDSILETLKKTPLKIQSIFSHLAASEDLGEKEFTQNQIYKFNSIVKKILDTIDYTPILHLSNTSGIINYPEAQFDMVRLGIGMYGFGNDKEETSNLKNVGTLKSVISQIHTINKGESLGYNRAFFAKKETKSATIPIGHADGINRRLGSGVGYVTINNIKCPILGNVCMDMIMVNVTSVNCKEGDEVIIFNSQETINDFAKKSDTISYEIITGISQRITRSIIS
jgi:alanine racemase